MMSGYHEIEHEVYRTLLLHGATWVWYWQKPEKVDRLPNIQKDQYQYQ